MIVYFLYCFAWSPDGICDVTAAWTIRAPEWREVPCEAMAPPSMEPYLVSCEKRRETGT
jgi:hypothetical protein